MSVSFRPFPPEWCYALLVQPYKEGAARLNMVFENSNPLDLETRPLLLKEKVVFLGTGFLLTFLPLINTIVWIAMQYFGNATYFTNQWTEPPLQPPFLRGRGLAQAPGPAVGL